MSKNYEKPIKKALLLLGLLIVSPLTLHLGFRAQKVYTESPNNIISYILLGLGGLLIILTIYFGFKTIQSFLNVLFD